MSHDYVPVQWNRQKILYDRWLWAGILGYLILFMGLGLALFPDDQALTPIILMLRALGSCGFLLLTLILCIGPLARLDRRFLPLLYNRRHMGVSLFVLIPVHAVLATFWYHSFGPVFPLLSIFTSNGSYDSVSQFPFQPIGAAALVICFLLAATSHDYWNANLGAPLWKALHMSVYLAYILVVGHIAFGALMSDFSGMNLGMVVASLGLVCGLHLVAGIREVGVDRGLAQADWVDIGAWSDIPNDRAKIVTVGSGERVAVFRYDQCKLAAVANACQHQNGPLGEGCVRNGEIICPWHGFQYRPEDGRSPPPFGEKIATYDLKLDGDRVLLNPTPHAAGTARPITEIPEAN